MACFACCLLPKLPMSRLGAFAGPRVSLGSHSSSSIDDSLGRLWLLRHATLSSSEEARSPLMAPTPVPPSGSLLESPLELDVDARGYGAARSESL